MKTSELTGAALDWAVVIALGYEIDEHKCAVKDGVAEFNLDCFGPSEVWSQGGPIIERERINLRASGAGDWAASSHDVPHPNRIIQYGPTPLIAAMRCFVASKLGDEVDVPEELT